MKFWKGFWGLSADSTKVDTD